MVNSQNISSFRNIGLYSQDESLIVQFQSFVPKLILLDSTAALRHNPVNILFIDDKIKNIADMIAVAIEFDVSTVLLTDLSKPHLETALNLGLTDYIPKPISTQRILHRIRQLEDRQLTHTNRTESTASNEDMRRDHLLDTQISAVISTTPDLVITGWNQSAEEIYGWRSDEVIGQRLMGLVPSIYVDTSRHEVVKMSDAGETWHGEIVQSNKFGMTKRVFASSSTIMDDFGIVQGYLTIAHDITDQFQKNNKHAEDDKLYPNTLSNLAQQRQFEESLTHASTEYQTILSSMTDPIFVFDYSGTYIKIPVVSSRNYYEQPEQLIGKQLNDVFPIDTADLFIKAIQRAIDTQSIQTLNYDLQFEDRRTYFSTVINPIAGRKEVVWVSRDITREKLNEIAITETEQRYRQLFESANDMLLLVDLETGAIIDANTQTQKQLDYTYQELIQLQITDIEEPLQDTKSRIITRTLMNTGHVIFEQNYLAKDGTQIPVETSIRLIDYRNKKVLLSFARNIKQRKLAMQAEAEERFFSEGLRKTIAKLAHTQSVDSVLGEITETLIQVFDVETLNIMLVSGNTANVVRSHGYHYKKNHPTSVIISSLFALNYMQINQQSIVISDTMNDSRWVLATGTEGDWVRSYVGAPIMLKNRLIGFLNLDGTQPNQFTNKHRQRLQVFADQVAITIENARLYEASQRYTEELEIRVNERTSEIMQANTRLTQQIEKREQVESKLAEEKNLLQTIINSLPVIVYVKNRQSQYTLANRFPYLTLEKQPFIGKSDLDLMPDTSRAQKHFDLEQELMAQHKTYTNEQYGIDRDGNERWNIITKVPLHDESGQVIGLVGVNQDMTQIKLAERQIHQLLSSAMCLLWSATVERVNDKFEWTIHIENEDNAHEFLPFDTREKDYTQAWLTSIPKEDQTLRESVANTYLQHGQQNYKLEYRCITEDGTEHWLSEDVQIRQIIDNRWHLIGVSLDISDIKFAEFALREAYDQMEQRVNERTKELEQANHELQQEIITRQQAEESERRQRILAEALQASITALNNTLEIDVVLDVVLTAMKTTVEHDASNIMLIENDTMVIVRQHGYPSPLPGRVPLNTNWDVPIVFEKRQPIVIPDTQDSQQWSTNTTLFGDITWVRSNVKIPIIYDERVIGILMLDSHQPNAFRPEHVDLLQTFANQASIALENARLYQAERQQRILAETIQGSIKAISNTLDIDDVLDMLLDAIQQNVETEAASIMLLEKDRIKVVRQRGYQNGLPEFIPLNMFDEIQIIIDSHEPYIIEETHGNEIWHHTKNGSWVRCNIKIPILHDDVVIGLINLDSSEPHKYSLDDAGHLQAFTDQASIAIRNAQLYQQAQDEIIERQRAEEAEREQRIFAETIRDTAITLNKQLNSDDLFDTIINAVSQVIKIHDTVSVLTFKPDSMIGTVVKDQGYGQHSDSITGLKIDISANKKQMDLIQRRIAFKIDDTHASDVWIIVKGTEWIRSHITLPIYSNDEVLAIINLDSQYPNTFTQEHVNQLVVFSHQVAIALQNAKLVEQIQGYTQELELRVQERTQELENERVLLQFERSQLRAILDAMRDGVYFTDSSHQAIYINNALVDLSGYSRDHWLSGRAFTDINRNVEIDRDEMWKDVERHLDVYGFSHREAELTRQDGSTFTGGLTRTEIIGVDGKRVGIVTVVRDISVDKQVEAQKARFIAHAAHELRTPITNIKTRLFLMIHKPENFNEHMRIAQSSANWMQSLVDNLFDHSRFERGVITLVLDDIVLNDIVNSIVETQRPEAEKKNITIEDQWDDISINMQADESRLRQVITNLINNAVAYTPTGGKITVTINLDIIKGNTAAIIKVSDTGLGIADKHLPYLFQPFYRATDDNQGTGLGLSISREIVEAHQGEISVESKVGEGTTFTVRLPLSSITDEIKEM